MTNEPAPPLSTFQNKERLGRKNFRMASLITRLQIALGIQKECFSSKEREARIISLACKADNFPDFYHKIRPKCLPLIRDHLKSMKVVSLDDTRLGRIKGLSGFPDRRIETLEESADYIRVYLGLTVMCMKHRSDLGHYETTIRIEDGCVYFFLDKRLGRFSEHGYLMVERITEDTYRVQSYHNEDDGA